MYNNTTVKRELQRPCRAHDTRNFSASNIASTKRETNGQWVWKVSENNNKSALKMKDIQDINDGGRKEVSSAGGLWTLENERKY